MKRVPEPELMEDPAQARAYAQADFREPNSAFVSRFLSRFPDLIEGIVWDLGCGPADIPLRLVRARPGLDVIAVDGAQAMLAHAREAIDNAGVGGRVRLVCWTIGDGAEPGALASPPAAVISNSLLHHLHEPGRLWSLLRERLAPTTPVMIMDLARPATDAEAGRIVATYAADAPDVLRRDFLASLRAAFTPGEVAAQLALAGLGSLAVEVVSDRHWMVHGRIASAAHQKTTS